MQWLSVAFTAMRLLTAVLTFVREAQLRGEGAAEALRRGEAAALEGLRHAEQARQSVRDSVTAKPDSLRDDDGFRR